jgi:hypothetical protein
MKLTLLTLTVAASLAQAAVAARAQSYAAPPTRSAKAYDEYRPARGSLQLRGPVRSVKEDAYNLHKDGDGIFTGNLTLRFDRRGRLVEFMRGNRQAPDLYDDKYVYRPDGRLASVQRLFDRKPGSRDLYVYDDARRRVEIQTYTWDGRLGMRVVKTYDARGGETRSEMELLAPPDKSDSGFKHVTETSYAYDEKGRPLSASTKHDGLPLVTTSSRRESDGRLVTTMKDLREAAQASMAKRVVTQDARGRELSTETYAADGTLTARITYVRKFDARGNWVEEITHVWEKGKEMFGESSFLRRRAITYF